LKIFSALAISLLALAATPSFAQALPYCNAGLRPDGFVDFSQLPTAPNGPTSAPLQVTLPVSGVPGLSVTLTIPTSTNNQAGPLYEVRGGTLFVATGSPLTMQFSSNVAGVSVLVSSEARGQNYTLGDAPNNTGVPASFGSSITTFTDGYSYFSTPLQEVGPVAGFTTTSIFGGPISDFSQAANVAGISNLRVQSLAANPATTVPTQGLQQWLRSESAGSQFQGFATEWPDQSGKGHDATAPTTPGQNGPDQIQQDGTNCRGAFAFANNSYFNFNLPINGWNQMTIFLVSKSTQDPPAGSFASTASAILWNENASWGNTFVAPYQKSVPFRFGTTQVNNEPSYTRPVTIGQDFTVTRAVHDGTTDSLYVDGIRVLSQGSKYPTLSGTTGAAYIGRGINNTYFNGEISEILIYDRVLTADETAAVEKYLRNKFGTN
jgi:Concanavalin A-like lectin/glucanases superfamily